MFRQKDGQVLQLQCGLMEVKIPLEAEVIRASIKFREWRYQPHNLFSQIHPAVSRVWSDSKTNTLRL